MRKESIKRAEFLKPLRNHERVISDALLRFDHQESQELMEQVNEEEPTASSPATAQNPGRHLQTQYHKAVLTPQKLREESNPHNSNFATVEITHSSKPKPSNYHLDKSSESGLSLSSRNPLSI